MKTLTYLKEVVPPVNVQRESNAFYMKERNTEAEKILVKEK